MPLSEFSNLDLICVHAALTHTGPNPSYHLLDAHFLQRQKPGCILLNAGRGALINSQALLKQPHLQLCLDVWENEPQIDLKLLTRALIATPHIAGYSREAKFSASWLLYRQAQAYWGLEDKTNTPPIIPSGGIGVGFQFYPQWEQDALEIYDPSRHTEQMRRKLLSNSNQIGANFLQLREEYSWRDSHLVNALHSTNR